MREYFGNESASIPFWDGYARWYKLWMNHNHYHNKIIEILTSMIKPRWKVVDIGAGNGVLSLPIRAFGCDVTALEPSSAMRGLLYEEALAKGIDWITVIEERWGDIAPNIFHGTDLIIACNSLHLTEIGFRAALKKAFHTGPNHLLLVTELCNNTEPLWPESNYRMLFSTSYEIDSSFAYHHIEEAREHWIFKKGKKLCLYEEEEIRERLIYQEGHFWLKDRAQVGLFWWEKDGKVGSHEG
jgi:hypothetical protein